MSGKVKQSFFKFITKYRHNVDGDHISHLAVDVWGDREVTERLENSYGVWRAHLERHNACPQALVALKRAWARYKQQGVERVH